MLYAVIRGGRMPNAVEFAPTALPQIGIVRIRPNHS